MSGSRGVEIVVPAGTRTAIRRRLGSIAGVKIVSEPTYDRSLRHLCVALAQTIEDPKQEFLDWTDRMRSRLGHAPLIVLWHEGDTEIQDWKIAQRIAYLGYQSRQTAYVAPDTAAARRLVIAQAHGAESMLIASAELVGEVLEVWSCEPSLYRIPIANLPVLAGMSRGAIGRFEVSSSGSRITWPAEDIDLDLESMRAATDPILLQERRATYGKEVENYGAAIRKLREEHGLRQKDISGLTPRTIRRVEKGLVLPHAGTLRKLASAHGLTLPAYMDELAARLRLVGP